jgi:hypothetical protein
MTDKPMTASEARAWAGRLMGPQRATALACADPLDRQAPDVREAVSNELKKVFLLNRDPDSNLNKWAELDKATDRIMALWPGVVKPKALEWVEGRLHGNPMYYATPMPHLTYEVRFYPGSDARGDFDCWACEFINADFPTPEDAQAAAQAHFDKAVRECLTDAPAQSAGWRSMDSAPKDGRSILLRHYSYKRPYAAMWKPGMADGLPWVSTLLDHGWPEAAFTGWMPLPNEEDSFADPDKVLVPREATEAMIEEGIKAYYMAASGESNLSFIRPVIEAAINAAPTGES